MKTIELTRGFKTLISNCDYAWVSKHCWYAQSNGGGKFYAVRDTKASGNRRRLLLHREILKLRISDSRDGEHKNGDSLDNRRQNLRSATRSQNHANRKRLPLTKSCKFRGVSKHPQRSGYTAQISIQNKKKHLGYFHEAIDAAKAYDAAAKIQFGEFANLNFPIVGQP